MTTNSSSSSSAPDGASRIRAIVVGADGQVGAAVRRGLEDRGAEVVTSTRSGGDAPWDLRDPAVPRRLGSVSADLVVLAGGMTTVDACERDPSTSRTINVDAAAAAAQHWGRLGARVVAFSSSQVFDGSLPAPLPTSPVSPRSEYARQKVELERGLLGSGLRATVVRMTKVVGPSWPRLAEWREALSHGRSVRAHGDLGFSPVPEDGVTAAVVAAFESGFDGIVHLSARDEMRYADFARIVAATVGADPSLVEVTSAAGGPHARLHSTLGTGGQIAGLWSNALTALDVVAGILV